MAVVVFVIVRDKRPIFLIKFLLEILMLTQQYLLQVIGVICISKVLYFT